MKKRGFTIFEIVITTMILAVVCIAMPTIVLKRNTQPKQAKNFKAIAECGGDEYESCCFDANTSTLYATKIAGGTVTEQTLDYNKGTNDFYTIELIGGGGGGTEYSHGYPGSSKVFFMPSLAKNKKNSAGLNENPGMLTGIYYMEPGKGGNAKNFGAETKFCTADSISPCNCKENILTAKGGVFSNEGDIMQADTQISNFNGGADKEYGNGGNKGTGNDAKGKAGAIIIK